MKNWKRRPHKFRIDNSPSAAKLDGHYCRRCGMTWDWRAHQSLLWRILHQRERR